MDNSDNIQFDWQDGPDKGPLMVYLESGPFRAIVEVVEPRQQYCYANRFWHVSKSEQLIGSGYTYGTELGQRLCELVVSGWGGG